jgi:POT family proton-dependent oligopeptide transporter
MAEINEKKSGIKSFPLNYWVAIIFEFFERGSYYGVMSVLSVYMTEHLGFAKESVGLIKGTIQPLLYFLPIITGAIADKMGYRKTLLVAFGLLGSGYFLTAQMTSYSAVFISLVIMGLGAGTFKPVISGTIAKVTDEENSGLGFGIFYWTINLGAFLIPMFLVPVLKDIDWSYVLIAAAIGTGIMIIPTLFLYKEPEREVQKKEPLGVVFKEIFMKIWMVFKDWRFILFIFIYSWFWILYFQMFDSVLWYVKDFVDATPLNNFVNSTFGLNWQFDIEHVTVINAFTIIVLQLFISAIVRKTKALPTMVFGISLGVIGMAIMSVNTTIWIFMAGIIIFSIGEMTAHPKFISYLGLIAPKDKKATYMGFGFLYGVFGSSIGSILGAFLYVRFVDNPMLNYIKSQFVERSIPAKIPDSVTIQEAIIQAEGFGIPKAEIAQYAHTSELWLLFSGIGVICIVGLLLYQKFIGTRDN